MTPDGISLPRTAQAMCRLRKIRDQEDITTLKYTPVETEQNDLAEQSNCITVLKEQNRRKQNAVSSP